MVCETCWDEETKGHTAGAEFVVRDCPSLFVALASGEAIDIADAAVDARTAELYRIYLQPVGCRSLLAMPVQSRGAVVGSVWAEDADTEDERQADAQTFLRAVAGMLAARFAARPAAADIAKAAEPGTAPCPPRRPPRGCGGRVAPQPAMRTASIASERNRRFIARLAARGLDKEGTAAELFPDTTVLVLRFIDPMIIAERAGDTGEAVIDRIVRELQRITEEHHIAYLKIMSDQIVAVEGFSGDSNRQAAAVIETALAIRDYCTRTFSRMAESPEFAMGIDTGMVIGSPVGFGSHAYNVWGETVRVASAMAASAPSGSIQVTEFHLPPCCRPVPVPRPRRLLPGAVRRDVDLCADGATVIQQADSGSPAAPAVAAPVRTLSALSPRRLLAAIGRPPLSLLRRLAMAAGFGAAVLSAAARPTTWRRPVRRELLRAMHQAGVQGVRATLVIGVLIGLAMVYQALYWLQAAGQTGCSAGCWCWCWCARSLRWWRA